MIINLKETLASKGWMLQEAQAGNLILRTGKSPNAPETAEFLPVEVMKSDKILWQFDKSYIGCFAFLREVTGVTLIVYATRHEVVDIIVVEDLDGAIRLVGGDYDWKRPVHERFKLKLAAADQMQLDVRLTPIERILKRQIDEQRRAQAEANSAAVRSEAEAEKQAAHERKQARKQELMRRPFITVYSGMGKKLSGRPVVGDEWQSISHGVSCVSVDSYQNGEVGEVREHFSVKQQGSNKSKSGVVQVSREDPTAPKLIEKMSEVLIDRDGDLDVIACYTRDGLKSLKADGLNSGAIRGVWPPNDDGSVTLVSFGKELKDIGNFQPLS